MSAEHDGYYNLAQRIDNDFGEIDGDTCSDLRNKNSEYTQMWREAIGLQERYPVIPQITEGVGDGAVSLSAEERGALFRYLMLKHDMENIERKAIYFRGHKDNYYFLKKIGALENTASKPQEVVGLDIVETLPWIDYREAFTKVEECAIAKRDMEIAQKMFAKQGASREKVAQQLRDLGVSDDIIDAARKQHEDKRQ